MKTQCWFSVVLLAACSSAFGLQGKLPKDIEKKANDQTCNIGMAGADAKGLVKIFNDFRKVKVGIDPKFANKTIKKIDFGGRNLPGAVDMVADKVGAKSFVVRDFLYIGKSLPMGLKPSFGDGKINGYPQALAQLDIIFPGIEPGSYRTLPWLGTDPKECSEELLPIMLYVHDAAIKEKNHKSIFFETMVFDNPKLKEVFKDWTLVMIPSSSNTWPKAFTRQATGGFALFLMTCDLRPHQTLTTRFYKQMNADVLAKMAQRVAKSNVGVAKRLARKFGKDTKVATQTKPAPDDPKKPKNNTAGALGGVLGGDEEPAEPDVKKPTKDPKKPPKKPEPEEEEEEEEEE